VKEIVQKKKKPKENRRKKEEKEKKKKRRKPKAFTLLQTEPFLSLRGVTGTLSEKRHTRTHA
jgi:hypothetical protein